MEGGRAYLYRRVESRRGEWAGQYCELTRGMSTDLIVERARVTLRREHRDAALALAEMGDAHQFLIHGCSREKWDH